MTHKPLPFRVQIQGRTSRLRFAFGEVKTSQEAVWPPSVMTGRHGLHKQIEGLRDQKQVKDALVLYLSHRAVHAPWKIAFQAAFVAYMTDPADVALFGFLVRDVSPDHRDLSGRCATLAKNCPKATSIELFALYLPAGIISDLPNRAAKAMGGKQ